MRDLSTPGSSGCAFCEERVLYLTNEGFIYICRNIMWLVRLCILYGKKNVKFEERGIHLHLKKNIVDRPAVHFLRKEECHSWRTRDLSTSEKIYCSSFSCAFVSKEECHIWRTRDSSTFGEIYCGSSGWELCKERRMLNSKNEGFIDPCKNILWLVRLCLLQGQKNVIFEERVIHLQFPKYIVARPAVI